MGGDNRAWWSEQNDVDYRGRWPELPRFVEHTVRAYEVDLIDAVIDEYPELCRGSRMVSRLGEHWLGRKQ
jgi:hypothetical protein